MLMDTWYATKDLMLRIEEMGKAFYCPLKANRSVDDSGCSASYRRVDSLGGRAGARVGQAYKGQGLPRRLQVEALPGSGEHSPHRKHRHQRSISGLAAGGAKGASAALEDRGALSREQAVDRHRALPVSQRAHPAQPHRLLSIGWSRLKELAYRSGQTVYRIKQGLLHDYLVQQLKNPAVQMVLA